MDFRTFTGNLLKWLGIIIMIFPFVIAIIGILGGLLIDAFGGNVSAEIGTNIGYFVGSILIFCLLGGFILELLGLQIMGETLFQVKKLKKKKR